MHGHMNVKLRNNAVHVVFVVDLTALRHGFKHAMQFVSLSVYSVNIRYIYQLICHRGYVT